jgi:hypothetical protein
MAAGAWTFTNTSLLKLHNNTFNTGDSYKMALFKTGSGIGASTTTFAGLTNEVNSAGYTAGGVAVTLSLSSSSPSELILDCTDAVFTASGGPISDALHAVIYEVSGDVVAYCLLDSTPAAVSVSDGNDLTVAISANGIYRTVPA